MHFRLTQKLAKKIKETGTLPALKANQNPLADWTANLFTADRTQYVILCNTATMYTCLFYGAGVNNDDKFIKAALQAIRDAMEDEGLEQLYLDKIVPATGSIRFGKSLNRSVTGSVTEQINAAKARLEDPTQAPYQVAEMLNRNLLSYLGEKKGDYGKPKEAFHALCQRVSPPQAFEGELPPNVLKFEKPKPPEDGRSREEKLWQKLAKTFNFTERMVRGDRLPADFYPEHAVALFQEPLSTYERSELLFLLHVWNRYDFPFELSEVAGWSDESLHAFGRWVTGQTLKDPCRYF